MGEIAVRARASKATLYKLFDDQQALFTAVLVREVERRRGAISEALRDPDPFEALRSAAYAMLDALDEQAVELFRLVIAEGGRHPDIGRVFYAELVETAAAPISACLDVHLGCGPDAARTLALQFVGAVKEPLFYPRLMGVPTGHDPVPVVDQVVRMTLSSETFEVGEAVQ